MSVVKVVSNDAVVTGKRVKLFSITLTNIIDPAAPETADLMFLVRDAHTLGDGEVICRMFAPNDTSSMQQFTFNGVQCIKGVSVELIGAPHADFTVSVEFA
jgi:hypothetical protein